MSAKKKIKKKDYDFEQFADELAEVFHGAWCHWASTLLEEEKDISAERAKRWKKLFDTPWAKLDEETKDKDRAFVSDILAVFQTDPEASLVNVADFLLTYIYPDNPSFYDPALYEMMTLLRGVILELKK